MNELMAELEAELGLEDLSDVQEELYVARTKWYQVGLRLKVPVDTLDCIKKESNDAGDQLCEAMKNWLKRVGVKPTWRALVDALRSQSVGESQLADRLEAKYCSTTMASQETSLMIRLKAKLEQLQLIQCEGDKEEEGKANMVKAAIREFITKSYQSGNAQEHVEQSVQDLHKMFFIHDPAIHQWAQELTVETYSQSLPMSHSPMGASEAQAPPNGSEEDTHPLFSKDTVYHAGICSLAVNDVKECDPGNYQKFFQKNPTICGHDFQQVSISRSKKDRYLIARQGESTVYIAFQSEPCIQQWPKLFRSFSDGITVQTERFPIHFLFELLRDGRRIVLTGFSFGGLLACAVAAQVWNSPHTTSRELRENLACITFGQPYLRVPLLLEIAEQRPDVVSTIHTIYWQDDMMPRLMRFLNECCSSLKDSRSSAAGAQLKLQEPPRVPFQDPMTSVLFEQLGKLQEAHLLDSGGPEAPEGILKTLLKEVASSLETPKRLPMCTSSYLISRDGSCGLVWDEMSKEQALLRSTPSSHGLVTNPFVEHSMAVYSQKVSWSYLEKPPSYATPPPPKQSLGKLGILEPSVSTVELHHHGNELAVTVEGNNLWFCYRTSVGGHPQDIPALKVYTGNSIQFNLPTKDNSGITVENEKVKITLHSHFHGKSKPEEVPVHQKDYSVTSRQRQLAKLTPSKLIELAYLSALLEQHQQPGKKSLVSHKVDVVRRFLENVVRVVPLESIVYAVAYGDDEVALQCTKALLSFYSQQKLPLSDLIYNGLASACNRMSSGISSDIYLQALEKVEPTEFERTFEDELISSGLLSKAQFEPGNTISESFSMGMKLLLEEAKLGEEYKMNPDGMPRKEVLGLAKLVGEVTFEHQEAVKQGNFINAVCGLNIEEVYPITHQHAKAQMHTNVSEQLQCPLDILRSGKMKLSSLAKKAQSIQAKIQSVPPATQSSQKRLDNSAMLKTVNDIRQKDLAICTALLGGFMEQQKIDIPLVRSRRDRSEAFSLRGTASVGVWALSSLNYDEIQPIFARCQGNQLLVKIEEYVKAIFSAKSMEADDDRYAAKLQFIVQGMTKTVSCNSQYISYSLERQLFELCDDKIDLSMPLDKLIAQWGGFFKNNILSLVALSHRPLIARWLKWALMVHNLREELAKYTAVGVAGLVNSGKSKLVNSLFGIQIPFGTKEVKRTTVPFMYNLEKTIQGLDVVDFPGVDDMDKTIPDLAELLLTLAQIVIFVVDYRKVHTESARKWLEKLQESSVPTLVCLTFADKLYAEHMSDKGEHPPTDYIVDELKAELSMIKEKLGVSPSRTVKFFSFSQDNDSVLNTDVGRQRLRDVGIGTPPEVGEWLVDVFKNRFGQDDLADRLQSFVQKTSTC